MNRTFCFLSKSGPFYFSLLFFSAGARCTLFFRTSVFVWVVVSWHLLKGRINEARAFLFLRFLCRHQTASKRLVRICLSFTCWAFILPKHSNFAVQSSDWSCTVFAIPYAARSMRSFKKGWKMVQILRSYLTFHFLYVSSGVLQFIHHVRRI